jgi:Peptidase M16 inactive domain
MKDRVADFRCRGEALWQSLDQRFLRRLDFFIGDRLLAHDALELFHELHQRSVSTPDYFALQVLNTILGGQFQSRLNANIRCKQENS